MKNKNNIIKITLLLFIITSSWLSCNTEDMNSTAIFKGQVVYSSNNKPFPNLLVQITDGVNIHTKSKTDADGYFALSVNIGQINKNYYLLVGDETCVPKRVELTGFGEKEVDLKVIPVDGPSTPVITKVVIGDVTSKTIEIQVQVSDDGRKKVTARGVCWSEYEQPTLKDYYTEEGQGTGSFVTTMNNLKASTTYYIRAYATNEMGTTYSSQQVVSTIDGRPIVDQEVRILAKSSNSVTCYGSIKSNGGFNISSQGFCWSTHQNPTIYDQHTIESAKLGEFSSIISNLALNTTYYFRAYATNQEGTSYSDQVAYEIGSTKISIDLLSVKLTRADMVECQAQIINDGGFAVTERGFCWSTSDNPTITDYRTPSGSGIGTYSTTLSKLPCGTLIYIRAYAKNTSGTAYSKQMTIMTGDGVPTFTTPIVSNIQSSSATVSVTITDDGNLPVLARGFCWTIMSWASFATLENADGYTSNGAGDGHFSGTLYPLNPNYTYYVCPYVTNAAGTFYGEIVSFKTLAK